MRTSKGLEALERIAKRMANKEPMIVRDYNNIEQELTDYAEIKEIAKHYHWEDLANDVFKVETDRKWQLKFESAICDVQEDYRKARALEIIKPYIHIYCIAPNDCGGVRVWFTQDGKHYVDIPQEEYNLLKEIMK